MKPLSWYPENEIFEERIRRFYSKELVDILIDWTDALKLSFKPTEDYFNFMLGDYSFNEKGVCEYSDKVVNFKDVINIVLSEISIVLSDENGTESRDIIEKEENILFKEKPIVLENGTKVKIIPSGIIGIIDGFSEFHFKYSIIPIQKKIYVNKMHVPANKVEKV